MKKDERQETVFLALCGMAPVIWLALLTAPYLGRLSEN